MKQCGEHAKTPPAFVVIAYRYGMRDAQSYLVAVCDTLEDAKDAAEEHVSWRGGKYGCEVVQCPRQRWDKDLRPRQVYYVPSPYEGVIGEGYEQVDRTTEGWKDRMVENLRSRVPRFDPPNEGPRIVDRQLVRCLSAKADKLEEDKEYNARLCEELREGMLEAWKIIDVLYMDALDHNGEAWPRAREWQKKWSVFSAKD